jgi:hypothetical protein
MRQSRACVRIRAAEVGDASADEFVEQAYESLASRREGRQATREQWRPLSSPAWCGIRLSEHSIPHLMAGKRQWSLHQTFRLSGVHRGRHDLAGPSPATSGSSRSDRLQASVAHCICRTARRDSCDNVEHRGATSTSCKPPAQRWTAFGLTTRGHLPCRLSSLAQPMNCLRARERSLWHRSKDSTSCEPPWLCEKRHRGNCVPRMLTRRWSP